MNDYQCRVTQDLNKYLGTLQDYEPGEYEKETVDWVDDTMSSEDDADSELCLLALNECDDAELKEALHDLTTIEARGINTIDTLPNFKVQALARAALTINKLIESKLEEYKP